MPHVPSSSRLIPGTEPTRTLPTCRHLWLSYGTPSRINDRHRQGREVNKSLLFWDFLASVAIHVIMLALLSLPALLQRNNAYIAIMLTLPYLLQCNNTCYVINTFIAITACLQYMQAVITLLLINPFYPYLSSSCADSLFFTEWTTTTRRLCPSLSKVTVLAAHDKYRALGRYASCLFSRQPSANHSDLGLPWKKAGHSLS